MGFTHVCYYALVWSQFHLILLLAYYIQYTWLCFCSCYHSDFVTCSSLCVCFSFWSKSLFSYFFWMTSFVIQVSAELFFNYSGEKGEREHTWLKASSYSFEQNIITNYEGKGWWHSSYFSAVWRARVLITEFKSNLVKLCLQLSFCCMHWLGIKQPNLYHCQYTLNNPNLTENLTHIWGSSVVPDFQNPAALQHCVVPRVCYFQKSSSCEWRWLLELWKHNICLCSWERRKLKSIYLICQNVLNTLSNIFQIQWQLINK